MVDYKHLNLMIARIVREGQEQNLNRWITPRTDSNKIRTRMSAELWSVSLNLSLLIEAIERLKWESTEKFEMIDGIQGCPGGFVRLGCPWTEAEESSQGDQEGTILEKNELEQ